MATIRAAESFIWTIAAVLRTHRGGSPHTEGVALMLAPEAHGAFITAKFTTKKKDIRLNIIQCYVPTNDADEEKNDYFYQQLQVVPDRRRAMISMPRSKQTTQQLPRDHAPVNTRQGSQKSSTGEDEGNCQPQAPRPAGRLPPNKACADQIASLRIIMEQSLEWNSPLYISFIDYEKAFNSVDRKTMWKLLRHYGVPEKIISLLRCTYQNMSCRIAHTSQLSESFEVKTGVQKRCLLSPFLFLLVIDWMSGA